MAIANDARAHRIREYISRQHAVDGLGEAREVRHSAAEDDHIRIEHVDHRREGASETIVVPRERRRRRRIAALGRRDDLGARDNGVRSPPRSRARARARTRTSRCSRACRSSTAGRETRRASSTAADCVPTRRRRGSVRRARVRARRCRRRHPFRGSRRTRRPAPAPAPSAASEIAKQFASLASRTGPAESRLEVAAERLADQPDGVRVFHEPRGRRDRAGNSDADRSAGAHRLRSPRAARARRSLALSRRTARGVGDALAREDVAVAARAIASIFVPPRSTPIRIPPRGDIVGVMDVDRRERESPVTRARRAICSYTSELRSRSRGSGDNEPQAKLTSAPSSNHANSR